MHSQIVVLPPVSIGSCEWIRLGMVDRTCQLIKKVGEGAVDYWGLKGGFWVLEVAWYVLFDGELKVERKLTREVFDALIIASLS